MKKPFAAPLASSNVARPSEKILTYFRTRAAAIGAVMLLVALFGGLAAHSAFAAEADATAGQTMPEKEESKVGGSVGMIVLSAAIVMAAALIAAGYAVAKVGSAALGAASERPELMVRALVFVALAEGIAVWGLIVAVMLIGKM